MCGRPLLQAAALFFTRELLTCGLSLYILKAPPLCGIFSEERTLYHAQNKNHLHHRACLQQ